jgi:membrane protein required for colicin V production
MSALDLLLLLPLAWSFSRGLRRGFLREIAGYAGLALTLILATRYLPIVTEELLALWPKLGRRWGPALSYGVLLAAGQFVAHQAAWWAGGTLRMFGLGWVNRLGGGIFGLLKSALALSLILILLRVFGLPPQGWRGGSILYDPLLQVAPRTYNALVRLVPGLRSYEEKLRGAFEEFSPLTPRPSTGGGALKPGCFDRNPHLVELKGFAQEHVDFRIGLFCRIQVPGHEHDAHRGPSRTDLAGQRTPIHMRHAQIGEDKLKRRPFQFPERLLSGLRLHDGVPLEPQQFGQHGPYNGLVIDDQHAAGPSGIAAIG